MPEGRQSPEPETQSGRQQQDAPGSGQGIQKTEGKKDDIKSEVSKLESNPTAPMDKVLDEKFAKTQ